MRPRKDNQRRMKLKWNKENKIKTKATNKKKKKGFSEKEINVDKQELTSLGCRRDLERDSN